MKTRVTLLFLILSWHAWGQKIIRGPYLQMAGPSSMTVRFRTDGPVNAEVTISTDAKTYTRTKKTGTPGSEHAILLDSLSPSKTYYYRIKSGTTTVGDSTYFFKTAPAVGSTEKFRHDYDGYAQLQDNADMGYFQIFNMPTKGELGGTTGAIYPPDATYFIFI